MNKIVCPKCGKTVEYGKSDIRIDEKRIFLDKKSVLQKMVICPSCRFEIRL